MLQGAARGHRGRADLPGRRAGCDPRSSGRRCCPVCAGSMPGTVAAAQFQPQTFQRHGCSRNRSRSSGRRRTHKRQGGPCGLSCLLCLSDLVLFAVAGVICCGRLEAVAGHSLPCGGQNIALYAFPGLRCCRLYFFRLCFWRFQVDLCAFCQISVIRYFFLFIDGHFLHLFSVQSHYTIFRGIVPCAILTAWYNVFCANSRLHGTMLDSSFIAWYNAITAKETKQREKRLHHGKRENDSHP